MNGPATIEVKKTSAWQMYRSIVCSLQFGRTPLQIRRDSWSMSKCGGSRSNGTPVAAARARMNGRSNDFPLNEMRMLFGAAASTKNATVAASGPDRVYEVGPGTVLAGLWKQANGDIPVSAAGTIEALGGET